MGDNASAHPSRPSGGIHPIGASPARSRAPGLGVPIGGVHFDSRHGDRLDLRAVFERPGDGTTSPRVTGMLNDPIQVDDPDLKEALRIHRLHWTT